jgi:hypothetical protein
MEKSGGREVEIETQASNEKKEGRNVQPSKRMKEGRK